MKSSYRPTHSFLQPIPLRCVVLVFADIRPDTLNLDERLLPDLITPRTRAIVPVHYAGVACEMSAIYALAQQHEIPIVEDNAHGLFGTYHGRALGTFGALATQSLHETKTIICGEGGALLVNDPTLVARAEILREKGTDVEQAHTIAAAREFVTGVTGETSCSYDCRICGIRRAESMPTQQSRRVSSLQAALH